MCPRKKNPEKGKKEKIRVWVGEMENFGEQSTREQRKAQKRGSRNLHGASLQPLVIELLRQDSQCMLVSYELNGDSGVSQG